MPGYKWRLTDFQPVNDGCRVLPAIQDGDHDDLMCQFVIDGKGKAFRERPVQSAMHWVDASKELQGVNVGIEAVQKVVADTLLLPFVESMTIDQILRGRAGDADFHSRLAVAARIRCLASCQGIISSSPASRRARRSSITVSCQRGMV